MTEIKFSDSYIYKILTSPTPNIDRIYFIITDTSSTDSYQAQISIIKQLKDSSFFKKELDKKLLDNGIIEYLEEEIREKKDIESFINGKQIMVNS